MTKSFPTKTDPMTVALVGVGGTGSEMLLHLLQLHLALEAFGYAGLHVSAFDPDTVSPANLVRQRFSPSDLGLPKASVLVDRVNLHSNLTWSAQPARFAGSIARSSWDLVISCVDSRRARNDLHRAAFQNSHFNRWAFWLDCGNDLKTGQAILGEPRHARFRHRNALPCATEIHPELMDVTLGEDDRPSCSAQEALARQDLFVNKRVALLGAQLLWDLFRHRELAYHGAYFDLATFREAPLPVPAHKKHHTAA
jgi:PRTRC genetic system ThiF family protein